MIEFEDPVCVNRAAGFFLEPRSAEWRLLSTTLLQISDRGCRDPPLATNFKGVQPTLADHLCHPALVRIEYFSGPLGVVGWLRPSRGIA